MPAHGRSLTPDWVGRGFKLGAAETRALPRSLPSAFDPPRRVSGQLGCTRRPEEVVISEKRLRRIIGGGGGVSRDVKEPL